MKDFLKPLFLFFVIIFLKVQSRFHLCNEKAHEHDIENQRDFISEMAKTV